MTNSKDAEEKQKTGKMASDQFCLKWNNYQANIVRALCNLKFDEDFVDVTLACDGQNIKAHKVILSACSTYFKNIFKVGRMYISMHTVCESGSQTKAAAVNNLAICAMLHVELMLGSFGVEYQGGRE